MRKGRFSEEQIIKVLKEHQAGIPMVELCRKHGISCSAAIWVRSRIASPEMFPEAEVLPHLICSRPMFIGGANDEADQHGDA